jgi:DNA-binding NarL/FixJ family response regulator
MSIRVVVADDSYLIREAVSRLVDDETDLMVVATAADVDSLLEAVDQHRPGVVVTDVRMPPTHADEGVRAAERIREAAPECGVVVLSQYVRREYAVRLFDRGAGGRAYLLKDRLAEAGELAHAVRVVAAGGSVVDPLVVDELLAPEQGLLGKLTTRELEVLREMASGANNAGIATSLVLSERAVAKHINSIFTKLDLHEEQSSHRRVQAVLLYLGSS